MKLYVVNKPVFEESVKGFYNSKEAHISAFNTLNSSVSSNSIPINLLGYFGENSCAVFQFKSFKDEVYFYEFVDVIS